jgi:hypothetical protein
MTVEEFNVRLEQLEDHFVAVLQAFENDTGVKVVTAVVELDNDGFYEASVAFDFANAGKTE